MVRSRRVLVGAISLAMAGAAVLTGTPAYADSPHCSGQLCAQLVSTTMTTFRIYEWSETAFAGHFELQTPAHATINTVDRQWSSHEVSPFNVTRQDGKYCANEWRHNPDGGYTRIGGICWNISV